MTCSENNVLIEHICVLDSLNIWIDFVFYLTYECLFFWISFMCFCCCKLFLYVIYTNHKDFFSASVSMSNTAAPQQFDMFCWYLFLVK